MAVKPVFPAVCDNVFNDLTVNLRVTDDTFLSHLLTAGFKLRLDQADQTAVFSKEICSHWKYQFQRNK